MTVKFIGKSKLTKQGQLTLPNEARKDLNISLEKELFWYEVDDFLVLVKDLINETDLSEKIKKRK